jgi:aminoglycoside/choline kinase family phosphotransferase
MKEHIKDRLPEEVSRLIRTNNLLPGKNWQTTALHGDGSNRRFYRIQATGFPSVLAVLPALTDDVTSTAKGLAEARSAYLIGSHLYAKGVRVPKILGFDNEGGSIIFEDLGDTLLQHEISPRTADPGRTLARYREVVRILVRMQLEGGKDFDPGWCWDTPRYDRHLMLTRESGYFLAEFCKHFLNCDKISPDLDEEFQALAERAAREPAEFFLHRDFQSRNLMVHHGEIRIIDFQGGRLGPLGYDLASLLIDPYVEFSREEQDELLACYIKEIEEFGINGLQFAAGYPYLALQRNLQILGAFAFLGHTQDKFFFRQYLRPALVSLQERLANPAVAGYPCLRKLCDECLRLFKVG